MFNCKLAIGTNLGNREENINSSLSLVYSRIFHPTVYRSFISISTIIETQAILPENAPQHWNIPYLNCIIALQTNLLPEELLTQIKEIEVQMGRNMSSPQWSPRIIDIDILNYNNQSHTSHNLQIPHPQIKNRPFILQLLSEFS